MTKCATNKLLTLFIYLFIFLFIYLFIYFTIYNHTVRVESSERDPAEPISIAQPVAHLTTDPGVDKVESQLDNITVVEIDYEIFSTIILPGSLAKVCAQVLFNLLED